MEYLSPAGQRLTRLPEQPGGTVLTHFPYAVSAGLFAYYQRVYETGVPETYECYYQAYGPDNYFHFAAQRSGERLVVSFPNIFDQPPWCRITAWA